jgi:hypothetical protein
MELGISQETALLRLSEKNILIEEDDILKKIADKYDFKTIEIIKIIKGEGSN